VIVAHGTWLPEKKRFFLWGETAQPAPPVSSPTLLSSDAHPYQLDPGDVERRLVVPLAEPESSLDATRELVTLLLPSDNGNPLASPELLLDREPSANDTARLLPFRIGGLALAPESALSWLVMLPTPEELDPHEFRLGADLRYWSTAARFALELLSRQKFLPSLATSDDTVMAEWEPLFETEIDRMEAFQAAMPPVCRAAARAGGDEIGADVLLKSFLRSLVDRFVRRAASRLRLRPRFVETEGEELLSSLLDAGGTFESERRTAEALSEELLAWKAQFDEEEESPFRIAFRLDPPEESEEEGETLAGESWELRYFLQAVDDESLLVPVARIWEHGGTMWKHLERFLSRPQEMVLEGLGRAATLFPPIEASLKESRPESCRLDLGQAYGFLKEGAFLLKESGYGVLLPAWWGKREHSVGLSLRVTPSPSGTRSVLSPLGLDALVEFDWQVALGGETLAREEFFELAELKQPLVRVRGQWVELSPERVEEVLDALKARPDVPRMTLGDVLQVEVGKARDTKLPVTDLEATGWVELLLRRLAGEESLPHLDPPKTFHGKLRPYQKHGLSWLAFLGRWNLGACLADDMGLGKTIQVLALLLHLDESGELDRPVLLICPTSVVSNWRKEAERFAPSLKVLIHHGQERHEGEAFQREASRHHLIVSTYSLVHRDLERLSTVEWAALVLDEAQNIKNPQAKQTRAMRKLLAPRRIALTGTPVENRLQELWSIMEFLNPGYLGSEASFRRRYALPIERYRDPAATAELRRLVEPFVLRRVKTDPTVIRDLPRKNEMKVYCSLTPEQATLYQAVVQESLQKIEASEGIGRKGEVLAALTRLKQICNHPAHFLGDGSSLGDRSGKLTRLTEMLEEVLAEGDRALVFTQYAEMGKLIQRHVRDSLSVDVPFLHGAVPATERERLIASFQEDTSGPPVFVLSLKAGGFGLNLTEARHVFHFDRWWNPAVEDQATDRAFRIGQTRAVAVYKFICAGTVEEKVDELAERKKELAEAVIQSGESFLTELSTDGLRELFELRKEALDI
jgi:SNF2 family DNA or RNA helicase